MASGNTLAVFTPLGNQPPAANNAELDTRNAIAVLNFDASTPESALFVGVLARNYAGGGLTVTVQWMSASATSGDVVWGGSFERNQDGVDNLTGDSFAAEQTATSTAPGTTGIIKYRTITFTDGAQIDSLAVGEGFRLK